MTNGATHIIGLDLGDGESCLTYVASDSRDEPTVYRFRNSSGSIPSVIAKYKHELNIKYAIGEDALWRERKTDLNINFKWDPVADLEQWRLLKRELLLFTEILFEEFAKEHPKVAEDCEIYIGCPSGWSEESRRVYEELFRESEILLGSRVHVVSESRSALIQALDYGFLPADLVNTRILLIDIGSSTTDVTAIDGSKPREIDVGHNLGLRQVDVQILSALRRSLTNRETLEKIEKGGVSYELLLYLCRLAKEKAFGRKVEPTKLIGGQVWLEECWRLLLSLDLKDCLQSTDFWYDDPWIERYRCLLTKLRHRKEVSDPRVIVVTGGGSNIPLLMNEARAAFPEAHPIETPEPSYSVARGLAGYGRWKERVDSFRKEAKALVRNLPLESKLSSELSQFYNRMIHHYAGSITEAIWRPIAYQWKADSFDLKNREGLLPYTTQLYRKWLEQGGQDNYKPSLASLSTSVNEVISEDIKRLGEKNALSVDDFRVIVHLSPLDLFGPKSFGEDLITTTIWDVQDVMFKVIDTLPGFVKRNIPDAVLEAALGTEEFFQQILGSVLSSVGGVSLSDKVFKLLAMHVRDAVDAEVERQLEHVELLLLTKSTPSGSTFPRPPAPGAP